MNLVDYIKVIIFGIIEGITEWLPISSTGHMILLEEWLPLNVSTEFFNMFIVVIQLGAILAVCLLFFKKLNPFGRKSVKEKRETWGIWGKIVIGCIPAGIIGILFDDWFEANLNNSYVVAATLIIYGVFFIIIENYNKGRRFRVERFSQLSWQYALMIGIIQILALVPGTSRSGATILGAMLLGVSRTVAAEYSFFLSVPIMAGASFIKLIKFGFSFTGSEIIILLLGMLVAFIVSIVAIKFLMAYIKRHDFKIFGYYRIVLGVIVLLYFLLFA